MTTEETKTPTAAEVTAKRKRTLQFFQWVAANELTYRRNGTYLTPTGEIITKSELKELTDA